MDFQKLISTAQQNVQSGGKNDKYYSTKFASPKKQPKDTKLRAGIQKFLEQQKREQEAKDEEARRKKAALIASRDGKDQRKIQKTLKTIKSSKKFHTGDKYLDENTAITLENQQPDEDDYGYVSNISEEFHKKLMEKYNNMPEDKKFSSSSGKSRVSTKEDVQRLKNSLVSKEDEQHHFRSGQQSRKSHHSMPSSSGSNLNVNSDKKSVDKPKPKIRQAPIVDFQALLKLAEQKQHEDIQIEVPSVKKKEERLLTSKEKKEQEEIEAARRARLNRIKIAKHSDKNNNGNDKKIIASKSDVKSNQKVVEKSKSSIIDKSEKLQSSSNSSQKQLPKTTNTNYSSKKVLENSKSISSSSNKSSSNEVERNRNGIKSTTSAIKSKPTTSQTSKVPEKSQKSIPQKSREFPPKDLMKPREFPPKDLMRSREFPPKDLMRSREFPPKDLKTFKRPKPTMNIKKRRIEDEDSEYDSEMDDFIDDGDEDLDYSNEIKKIFGYDKSRYRDEDFDDRDMESDFRTVMKEESISKRLGMLEDLEDMRREEEELRQKALKRKKMRKL